MLSLNKAVVEGNMGRECQSEAAEFHPWIHLPAVPGQAEAQPLVSRFLSWNSPEC